MKESKQKRLTVELLEPEHTSMRDLAKILRTINNLYNYCALLYVPSIKERMEVRVKISRTKRPKTLLYSSALEGLIRPRDRMNVVSISSQSPIKLTVEGMAGPIDAVSSLLKLLLKFYEFLKSLRGKSKEEAMAERLRLERDYLDNFERRLKIIEKIDKLDMPKELKEKLKGALFGCMRSIERGEMKPILSN